MAPLPAPAEKPSHRISESQSHAKLSPPAQVAVFCPALWPNLQPALTFATVRLRTTKTKGCLSRMAALTMVFKLCQSASKKWRRLDASHQIADIIQGVKFKDGEKLTERAA